jgi:hypothetical protein
VSYLFRDSPWPGMFIWAVLYVSDYSFTIVCAGLYRRQGKVEHEGSFELNPIFQADINALRRISPRFITLLIVSEAALWFVWSYTSRPHELPEAYQFLFGAMVCVELALHIRHVRNYYSFTRVLASSSVRGHMAYSRVLILRASASELLTFSGFFAILFMITTSWFLLGGAVGCAYEGLSHASLAQKRSRSIGKAA